MKEEYRVASPEESRILHSLRKRMEESMEGIPSRYLIDFVLNLLARRIATRVELNSEPLEEIFPLYVNALRNIAAYYVENGIPEEI